MQVTGSKGAALGGVPRGGAPWPCFRHDGALDNEGKAMKAPFQVDNASLADVQQALADDHTNSTELTQAYLARIAAYDRAGPCLNSVREVNPDALAIAAQ